MTKSNVSVARPRNKWMPQCISNVFRSGNHKYIGAVRSMIDGRSVMTTQMCYDNVSERFKGLKPEDFCLENLQANNVELREGKLGSFGFVPHDAVVTYLQSNVKPSNSVENESK